MKALFLRLRCAAARKEALDVLKETCLFHGALLQKRPIIEGAY